MKRSLRWRLTLGAAALALLFMLGLLPLLSDTLRSSLEQVIEQRLASDAASLIAAARSELEVPPLKSQALHVLLGHDWPGNIRELRNIAERYVLLGDAYSYDLAALMNADGVPDGLSLSDQVACYEKALIEQTLNRYNGNIKLVMEALDIPRKTLSDKMKKYGLERGQFLE